MISHWIRLSEEEIESENNVRSEKPCKYRITQQVVTNDVIMLKGYSTYRWLQVCLGLIFVQYILSDCLFPEKELENGRFILQSSDDINATTAAEMYLVRFRCFPGYTRIGPQAIICVKEQWTGVVPTCTKMQCLDPPAIENGKHELHSGVNRDPTLGSVAVYSCNDGYELENDTISNVTCRLENKTNTVYWKGDVPKCRKKESCPDPGISTNGKREGRCCFKQDVLHYSCNEGFQLVGEEEIQCLSTGRWSSWRPLCRPLSGSCDVPPRIMHGLVPMKEGGDYYLLWEEVEVLCEPGYSYDGETRYIMCEEGGQWEDEFRNCTETICNMPKPFANGRILELESTNSTEFPYNFELTYVCDKGYRLEKGDSWRLCETHGWSGVTPSCTAVHCPNPGAPDDGSKEGSSYEVGATVRFKCSTGYFLMGSIERHCMPNGQWTGELARCDSDLNYCPNPGIPINGFKNNSNYDMGEIVGFGCSEGYSQVGSQARECMADHTWSGKETICLGPYDFDNSAQIRDQLQITMKEKAAKQEEETRKYRAAQEELWNNGMGRIIDVNHPGRLILYFLFDVSGSVGRINFDKSIDFAKAIVKKVGISKAGARAGALTFSSEAEIQFLPLDFTTTDEVMNAFDLIEYKGGGTSATSALTLVREEFMPLTEGVLGKKNVKSIVFLLTDGRANMGGNPETEADILKKAGVEIYCIGITGDVLKESLYKIASDSTEEQHVFILESYNTLSWLIQELTNGTVDYSQCGLGLESAGRGNPRGRIVDGSRATEPWPWMVAVYFLPHGTIDPAGAELKCGGSIINKFFILTAAHCMYTSKDFLIRDIKEIIVKLGLTNVKNETFVQEPEVKSFFIHPKYRAGSFYDYDVAILQLSKPIEYNAYVRPICLPPKLPELPENSKFYKPLELAHAIGWGHQGIVFKFDMDVDMKVSEHLKELILPIQTREACHQSLVNNRINASHFTDRMFCAGQEQGGNDTCKGDSGGPLMQHQLNEEGYVYWTQVGIVSWGIGCGVANTFGYYSHVSNLRSWIDEQIVEGLAMD